MKISIFGLGYVGCVSLGCLAKNGNELIGVDISKTKVDLINEAKPTIVENQIDELIAVGVKNGSIKATMDYNEAVNNSEISIVCVGTPSTKEGHLNLDYIYSTAEQIGSVLKDKDSFHIIAIRSTVLPGTNERFGEIIEKSSGKNRNKDFTIISNPEFLREGTAVDDYFNPPVTVIGGDHENSVAKMAELYKEINAAIEIVDIRVAELIKYVNNSFHALKITFANEIGNISKRLGIDSHQVMKLFTMDKQLNISPYYFKPGFAYGGSCLPKDLKGLNALAHDKYLDVPVLNAISNSNELQKNSAYEIIISKELKKIGILGLSFKPGTDDLRYSPIVDVIEKLLGKGYDIRIFDKNVSLAKLIGQNKSYIQEKLPHISDLLVNDLSQLVEWAEILVFTYKDEIFENLEINHEKEIVDLANYDYLKTQNNYEGICW